MTKKYFYLDESQSNPGKYMISFYYENFLFLTGTEGSFNVVPARVMGMTYATYLRYCRDEFGAELIGKNCLYVVPYFEKNKRTQDLIDILNLRMISIMDHHKI